MKNLVTTTFLFGIAIAITGVLQLPAQTTPRGQGQGMRYNPATETTVSGTVQDVQHLSKGRASGTHLILNTDQGVYEVHVGPDWFLNQKKVTFAKGDQLQVKGSIVNETKTMIAREITKNGETVMLRDQQGFPLWSRGMGMGMRQGIK